MQGIFFWAYHLTPAGKGGLATEGEVTKTLPRVSDLRLRRTHVVAFILHPKILNWGFKDHR